MAIFNKYGPCRGVTLFKWKQFRLELWVIPARYTIIEHRHPEEDVELMYLAGSTAFCRRDIKTNITESAEVRWPRDFCKRYSVKNYHTHWFSVGRWPLVFLNFQTFLSGCKPKSAAKDFLVTNYEHN